MANDVLLSIIIVAYKSEATILGCLNSIYNNGFNGNFEVMIVDNEPEGRTASVVESSFGKRGNLYITRNSKNGGFGQGNNVGSDLAHGKYLLFLNPDTVLVDPILNRVVDILNRKLDVSIVGCRLVSRNLKNVISFSVLPEHYSVLSSNKLRMLFLKFTDLLLKGHYPWGAFMAVRKKDFFNAGRFDEKFFLNFEEADLVHRLGNSYVYILKERVIHDEGVSKNSSNVLEHYFISEKYYFSKYGETTYSKFKKTVLLRLAIKKRMFRCLTDHEREQIVRYAK